MTAKKSVTLKSGLTRRWFIQTTVIVIALLLIICIVGAYAIHTYYYASVDKRILAYSNKAVDTYFDSYLSDDESFELGARNFINDFYDKSSVEVWVIDRYGNIIISSSGFSVSSYTSMPDYNEMKTDTSVTFAQWTGKLDSGEKITSLSKGIFNEKNEMVGAVRFMISLEEISAQINSWYLIIVLLFIIIVSLLLVSGTVYINSIVKPISEINETARMIADGNYDARIDHYLYKDEIGDLCETINNMAEKIKISDKIKNDFISDFFIISS